jgi:hypothetical protein
VIDLVVEIFGDTARATLSTEDVQRVVEASKKKKPESFRNPADVELLLYAVKSSRVTNFFQGPFFGLRDFNHQSPPTMIAVSNHMEVLVANFIALRDAYATNGFDHEWQAGVKQSARSVYLALSNVVLV